MSVVVLLVVIVILTLLIHIVPGDPATTVLGPRASPEAIQKVRAAMGLDKSVFSQIGDFIWNVLHGNLGTDVFTGRSIGNMVSDALPNTVALALAGLLLAVISGVPLGIYSAHHKGSWADRLTAMFSVSMTTIPTYVAGLVLLIVFSVTFRIMPATGTGKPGDISDYLKHLILPAAALAITWIGYIARLVRAGLLEVMNENYIQAARAAGISERRIRYKYALKNAMIPTIAVIGNGLGGLMGGAVFVEVIFARSGMGTLILKAIEDRNYPLVRVGVLCITILFIIINLLTDILYAAFDKRIQLGKARE